MSRAFSVQWFQQLPIQDLLFWVHISESQYSLHIPLYICLYTSSVLMTPRNLTMSSNTRRARKRHRVDALCCFLSTSCLSSLYKSETRLLTVGDSTVILNVLDLIFCKGLFADSALRNTDKSRQELTFN